MQIADLEELLQDLRPRRRGADPRAADHFAKRLILNELAGIFHGQNDRAGGVALRRRSLPLLDKKIVHRKARALPELCDPFADRLRELAAFPVLRRL